jgi:hypothetical protein
VDRVGDRCRIPVLGEPDDRHDAQQHDSQQRQAQDHGQPVGREAVHVLDRHEEHRRAGDDDLQDALVQPGPEHRQVVGDGDRADRHHDQVVEQDRPAGDEAPELVEGVARERRGSAALRVERAALDVGGDREDEQQARQQEGDGREAERVVGHLAEHHEQPGHDRAEQDREQRRLAQPA